MEMVDFQLEEYLGITKSHYTFQIQFVATHLPEIGQGGFVKEEVSAESRRNHSRNECIPIMPYSNHQTRAKYSIYFT